MTPPTKEKGRPGWHREAALHNNSSPHRSAATSTNQARRLPAYGRQLVEAQRHGLRVAWLVIALDWDIAKPLPRVVVPRDMSSGLLDLSFVRDTICAIAHRDELARALDVAEIALRSGAVMTPVHDVATGTFMTTYEVCRARGLVQP